MPFKLGTVSLYLVLGPAPLLDTRLPCTRGHYGNRGLPSMVQSLLPRPWPTIEVLVAYSMGLDLRRTRLYLSFVLPGFTLVNTLNCTQGNVLPGFTIMNTLNCTQGATPINHRTTMYYYNTTATPSLPNFPPGLLKLCCWASLRFGLAAHGQ